MALGSNPGPLCKRCDLESKPKPPRSHLQNGNMYWEPMQKTDVKIKCDDACA